MPLTRAIITIVSRLPAAEAHASSSAREAGVSAERSALASQLEHARLHAAGLQTQLDSLAAEHASFASDAAGRSHSLALTLEETERNRDTYKTSADHSERRVSELQQRLRDADAALHAARAAASSAASEAEARLAAAEKAAAEAEARAGAAPADSSMVVAGGASSSSAMSTGVAAHGVLSSAFAGDEGDVGSLTKAAIYARYVDARREQAQAVAERDEASETLRGLLAELHAKAPRVHQMRQQLIDVSASHEEMALRLDAASAEGAALRQTAEALQTSVEHAEGRVNALEKELNDRTLQLQLCLEREQQLKLNAATSGGGGFGGAAATPRRASLSNLAPPPSFGIVPSGGSPFGAPSPGFGGGRASGGSSTAGGAGPSDAMRTPDDVLAAHLVPFRDIEEMQQKNAQLVRTVRALTQAHEADVEQREQANEGAVAAALEEVTALREASAKQQSALEQLTTQRDLYKSLRSPTSGGGRGSFGGEGTSSMMVVDGGEGGVAMAAAHAEAAALRDELSALKEGNALAEAELVTQLERAREGEKTSRLEKAALEASQTVLEARLQAMAAESASGGTEASEARRQIGELTSQHVSLQTVLKERSEELLAAQGAARREAGTAEVLRQEKSLLTSAREQLATQLEAAGRSNAALQQTMSQMSEAHAGWRQSESDGTKRLHEENDTLRREWVEAKAALGRERDRAADAKREAELTLAVAQEATEAKGQEVAKAREEVARLEGQLGTMKELHDTVAIQLQQLQQKATAQPSLERVLSSAGSGASGGALAEELAAARRKVSTLETALEAEKAHGLQYKALAEAAETERDEQLRLSAEVKAAADGSTSAANAAKTKAEEERAAGIRTIAARVEEVNDLRGQLDVAKRAAESATQTAREASAAGEARSASAVAEVEALKIKLAAAEEEAERNGGKYRTELLHHSEDMQALASAKEAAAEALSAREVAESSLAEVSATLDTSRSSFDERASVLQAQLSQLDERLSNSARENALLHAQVQRLTEEGGGGAAGGGADGGGEGEGGSGENNTMELLTIVRRDKTLLTQKNELLTLEVSRLKQTSESTTRQLALSSAKLVELQKGGAEGGGVPSHEEAMANARELNLLRDSNSLMRSRESQKEVDAKESKEREGAMRAQIEPLQKAKALAEKEAGALSAQLEQERKETKTWQKRVRELLDKTGKSVGQDAYEQLEKKHDETSKALEASKAEAAASKAAKEKAEAERDESKRLEQRLRQAGGKFKEQVKEKERCVSTLHLLVSPLHLPFRRCISRYAAASPVSPLHLPFRRCISRFAAASPLFAAASPVSPLHLPFRRCIPPSPPLAPRCCRVRAYRSPPKSPCRVSWLQCSRGGQGYKGEPRGAAQGRWRGEWRA